MALNHFNKHTSIGQKAAQLSCELLNCDRRYFFLQSNVGDVSQRRDPTETVVGRILSFQTKTRSFAINVALEKEAATQQWRRAICPTSVLSNAPSLRRRIGQVSVFTSWLATRNTVFNTTNRVGSQFDAMTKLGRFAFQNNQEIDFLYEL